MKFSVKRRTTAITAPEVCGLCGKRYLLRTRDLVGHVRFCDPKDRYQIATLDHKSRRHVVTLREPVHRGKPRVRPAQTGGRYRTDRTPRTSRWLRRSASR